MRELWFESRGARLMRTAPSLALIFTALILVAGPLTGQAPVAPPPAGTAGAVFPGTSWDVAPSAKLGTECHYRLDSTRDFLQTLATTALIAVKEGHVLFSYGPVESVSYIASARKSVLAMMYGKYVADGKVDLDKTLAELEIDDIGGLLPVERQARLRDLLTARSGVFHPASNEGDDLASAPPRGSQAPGTYFLYSNWISTPRAQPSRCSPKEASTTCSRTTSPNLWSSKTFN
jgi:CubicO group peptidase (beta-lactamase class C family)